MTPSIPDTRTREERIRMNQADEEMARQWRLRLEMDRKRVER